MSYSESGSEDSDTLSSDSDFESRRDLPRLGGPPLSMDKLDAIALHPVGHGIDEITVALHMSWNRMHQIRKIARALLRTKTGHVSKKTEKTKSKVYQKPGQRLQAWQNDKHKRDSDDLHHLNPKRESPEGTKTAPTHKGRKESRSHAIPEMKRSACILPTCHTRGRIATSSLRSASSSRNISILIRRKKGFPFDQISSYQLWDEVAELPGVGVDPAQEGWLSYSDSEPGLKVLTMTTSLQWNVQTGAELGQLLELHAKEHNDGPSAVFNLSTT